MSFYKVLFIFLLFNIHDSSPAKILCFFPTTSKSQIIVAHQLMLGLVDVGHEVTLVSQFSLGKNLTNFREIIIVPETNVAGKV